MVIPSLSPALRTACSMLSTILFSRGRVREPFCLRTRGVLAKAPSKALTSPRPGISKGISRPALFSDIEFLLFNLIKVKSGNMGQFEGPAGSLHHRLVDHFSIHRGDTAALFFRVLNCTDNSTGKIDLFNRGGKNFVDDSDLSRIDHRFAVKPHSLDQL